MELFILFPPVAFTIVFIFMWLQYKGLSVFSAGEKWPDAFGKRKPYACGEDIQDHRVQPDYREFFPFAFFFTIMHVVALMVATLPVRAPAAVLMAAIYLIGSVIGLFILFRR